VSGFTGNLLRLAKNAIRQKQNGESNLNNRSCRSHLITLSALASRLGGIVRPIFFAVFRLLINSNFVDCWTGRLVH
jgi:hypothetical protein